MSVNTMQHSVCICMRKNLSLSCFFINVGCFNYLFSILLMPFYEFYCQLCYLVSKVKT